MTPPLCHLVHWERHFIQGRFSYLADRNNLLTFALVIGKRWKRKNRGTWNRKYNPLINNWVHFKNGHILNPVWTVWSFWVKHSNRLRWWISVEKSPWKSRKLLWWARKGQISIFEMFKSWILPSFGGSSTYICYMHAYDVWASPCIGSCHYVYENCIGTWLLQRYSVYAAPPKEGFLSASLADRL